MCFGIVTYTLYLNGPFGIGFSQFDEQQFRLGTDGVARNFTLQYLAILLTVILIQVTALKMVVDNDQRVVSDLQPPSRRPAIRAYSQLEKRSLC